MKSSLLLSMLMQIAVPDNHPEQISDHDFPPVPAPPSPATEAKEHSLTLSKGLQILITVEKQIGSKISQRRDFFPIKLAQPVSVDGKTVLPAGIAGKGQVVHAKKGGFAGSAGELVLAARYLEHDGRKIALRSFKFVTEDDEFPQLGQDNSGVAMAATIFAAPLGFLIGGGNTIIEPGTLATAKLKEDFVISYKANSLTKSKNSETNGIHNDSVNKGNDNE